MNNIFRSVQKIKSSRLGKDVLYVFGAQVAIMISVFCVNKIISIYVGVIGFGLFSLIKRAGGVIQNILQGGTTTSLPRYVSRFCKSRESDIFNRSLLSAALAIVSLYTIGLALLYFIAPSFFNDLLFQKAEIESSVLVATMIFALGSAIEGVIFSYYQGRGDFKYYNTIQIICSSLCLGVTFLFRHNVTQIVLYSYLAILLYSLSLTAYEYKRLSKIRNQKRKSLFTLCIKTLGGYGIARMCHDLVSVIQDILPLSIILARFGMKAVGLYSAGLSIPLVIAPLFAFTGGVFLQRVSALHKNRRYNDIRRMMNIALLLFLGLSILGSVIVILLGDSLMVLFYSELFLEAVSMVPYFALTLIPRAIYLLYRNPLDAISTRPYNFIVVVVRTIIFLLLLLLARSLEECAIAYLISSVSLALLPLSFWFYELKKLSQEYNSTL